MQNIVYYKKRTIDIERLLKHLWDNRKIDVYIITVNKDKYLAVADETTRDNKIRTLFEISSRRKHCAYELCLNGMVSKGIISEDLINEYVLQ